MRGMVTLVLTNRDLLFRRTALASEVVAVRDLFLGAEDKICDCAALCACVGSKISALLHAQPLRTFVVLMLAVRRAEVQLAL